MNFNEYQEKALSTAIYPKEIGLIYTTLGLVGEAGEIANKVKKVFRDDNGELSEEMRSLYLRRPDKYGLVEIVNETKRYKVCQPV